MNLRARLAALTGSDIRRDVARLVLGTAGGRLIMLAALPFVTRLYSPADFAMLAVYLGLVSLVSSVACLRFDIAIPMAEDEKDATHLLVLALTAGCATSALGLLIVLAAPQKLAGMLGQPDLAPLLWLAPVGVFMAASYSALQFWATHARRFGTIAVTRITQAGTGASVILVLGWLGAVPLGLLLGNMLNVGAGSLRLGMQILRQDTTLLAVISRAGIANTFRRYQRYPLYSTPEALASVAAIQLPILLIAAFAGAEAGYLLLALQIMTAPMALLGSSVAQVYVSRAAEELHKGKLAELTAATLHRLLQIGPGPLIFIGIMAPIVFPLVFGAAWTRSAEIVSWMIPWIALQFVASPVSTVLHVTGRQHWAMNLQLAGLVLRAGPVLVAALLLDEAHVPALIVGSVVFYGVYLAIILKAAEIRPSSACRGMLRLAAIYWLPWVLTGIVARTAAEAIL